MKKPHGKAWNYFVDYALVIIGTAALAFSVDVFTVPNHVVPGGVTGIATIIYDLTGISVGVTSLLINIPLLILGFIFLGKKFIFKTLVSTIMFTVFADAVFVYVTPYTNDPLLATIYAGVCMGAGLGIIYLRGGSSGGTDITSRLLQKKYPHMKMGMLTLITNCIIVGFGAFVFSSLEAVLYAIVLIFIQSQLIDKILYGLDTGKMIMIVTSKKESISEAIMLGMKRGCTLIPAKGAYSGDDRAVVLCAIHRNEFYRLKKIVYQIDSHAFVIVTDAGEVVGRGFASDTSVPKELQ